MCGICGIFGSADKTLVDAMSDAIAHRGPDDHGSYVDPDGMVAFGHRRLAIIDLSPAGHQPMSHADGRYWIVFNGEIYNFASLRDELKQHGHSFHTATDTEVILAAYVQWGVECLGHLRGMFALALYDRTTQSLFIARDRFGIKPLYYAQNGTRFAFASELKALLASGLVSRRADTQSLQDYLSLGSIPQPNTIWADIKAVPPGGYLVIKVDGTTHIDRYWDIAANSRQSFPDAHNLSLADAAVELRHHLDEATKLHMIADVPVGAFLSGGIDSTAIVGLMNQYVSHPIKTYSIGFEEEQHQSLNELSWARIAAERFGTIHTEVILSGQEVARCYDQLIQAIDQPSLDGTNSYFVSKATREGVTVALSGLGGDELLAGYPQFRSFQIADRWPLHSDLLSRSPLLHLLPYRYRQMAQLALATPSVGHSLIRNLINNGDGSQIIGPAFEGRSARPLADLYNQWLDPTLDVVQQVSYVEVNGYMANTLLRDVDAMSMAHALEVRPIFLDHVLAEFIFALNASVKIDGRTTKRVLIEALGDMVPESIIHRSKRGFEMPLSNWLGTHLKSRAQAALSSSYASAIFAPAFLKRAVAALDDLRRVDARLWAYVMLVEWLQFHQCEL